MRISDWRSDVCSSDLLCTRPVSFGPRRTDPGHPCLDARQDSQARRDGSATGDCMNLQNKRVLVTAAGQGIGLASAIAFARAGAEVFASDIDIDWKNVV